MDTIINTTINRELAQVNESSAAVRYDELLNVEGFVGRIICIPNFAGETIAMIEEIEPNDTKFGTFDLLVRRAVEDSEVEDEVLFLERLYVGDIEAMLAEADCGCSECEALRV